MTIEARTDEARYGGCSACTMRDGNVTSIRLMLPGAPGASVFRLCAACLRELIGVADAALDAIMLERSKATTERWGITRPDGSVAEGTVGLTGTTCREPRDRQ